MGPPVRDVDVWNCLGPTNRGRSNYVACARTARPLVRAPGGAYLGGAQLVLLVVLAGIFGRRMLSILLFVSLAVISAGILLEVIGNFQFADSIWRTRGNRGFGDQRDDNYELRPCCLL